MEKTVPHFLQGWGKPIFLSSSELKQGAGSSLSRHQKCRRHHLRLLAVPFTPAFPPSPACSAHRHEHLDLG